MILDLGVTEVNKIDSTWDKSDSKSTLKSTWICLNLNLNFMANIMLKIWNLRHRGYKGRSETNFNDT